MAALPMRLADVPVDPAAAADGMRMLRSRGAALAAAATEAGSHSPNTRATSDMLLCVIA